MLTKKSITALICFSLISFISITAQTNTTPNGAYFISNEFLQTLIEEELLNWNKLTYVSNSIENPKIISLSPKKIKAYYLYTNGYNQTKKGWIDVCYEGNIPFGVFTNLDKSKCLLPNEISKKLSTMFKVNEVELIEQLNKKYREKIRKSNESYLEVMKIHNSYPITYNITNCLAATSYEKAYTRTYSKSIQITAQRDMDQKVTEYHSYSVKALKNISNHPIVIKGFYVQSSFENENKFYSDISKIVQPGEMIDEIIIQSEFDDDKEYSQYIGKVGIIKNLKNTNNNSESSSNSEKINAKKISTNQFEINSYTNTTQINIKKGEKINISAEGSITFGGWAGSGGPVGIDGYTSYNRIQGFRHGSLLVRIGDEGEWEAVGTSISIVAKKNGVLQFIVNDEDPSNNSGAFTVDLLIANKGIKQSINSQKKGKEIIVKKVEPKVEPKLEPKVPSNNSYEMTPEEKLTLRRIYQGTMIDNTLPKKFTGNMTNTSINKSSICDMTLSKNIDGSYQLKGNVDNKNLIGLWNLKGYVIDKDSKIMYEFKGEIDFGYVGTDYPIGTKAPFIILVEIDSKSMKGTYTIGTFKQNNIEQYGTIDLY